MTPAPNRLSKAEYVSRYLRQQIIDGKLASGDIIRTETVCTQCHVSSSPAREALMRLCSIGIIQPIPRCGFVLVRPSAQEFRELLEFMLLLQRDAAMRILTQLDEKGVRELQSFLSKNMDCTIPGTDIRAADNRAALNMLYMRLSGNALYCRLMQDLSLKNEFAFAQFKTNYNVRYAYNVSDALIEALIARDRTAVLAALDEIAVHTQRAIDKYEQFLAENPLPPLPRKGTASQ